MSHLVAALAVLTDGILAGVFLGSGLVEQAAKTLSRDVWLSYKQAKERVYGRAGPMMLGAAIVVSTLSALTQNDRTAWVAAILSLIGVLAVTGLVHVPLNRAIDGSSPEAPPSGWENIRSRWRRWHWLRAAFALAAFVCAIMAFGDASAIT